MCAKFKWQEEKDDGKPAWYSDGSSSTRGEKTEAEVQAATFWDRYGRKALFSLLWVLVGVVVVIAVSFRFTNRVKAVGRVEPLDVEYITAPAEGTVRKLARLPDTCRIPCVAHRRNDSSSMPSARSE